MASWDEQIEAYEAKIESLEKEFTAYVKTTTFVVSASSGLAFLFGLLVGSTL